MEAARAKERGLFRAVLASAVMAGVLFCALILTASFLPLPWKLLSIPIGFVMMFAEGMTLVLWEDYREVCWNTRRYLLRAKLSARAGVLGGE